MTGNTALDDRNRAILEARANGDSVAVIAERHGVSRARVEQIVRRARYRAMQRELEELRAKCGGAS